MTAARGEAASAPRPRARRGEGDRLREDILDATEVLLAKADNPVSVSVRGIAKAVGVTAPSIYLHFADKAELFYAVCEREFANLDRVVEDAAATTDDPLESLRRRGAAYVRFALTNPELYRVLFMGAAVDEPAAWSRAHLMTSAAFGHLEEAVRAAMDAGAVHREDPFLVATGLWTQVHGIASLLIAKPEFPWPDIDVLVDHVLGAHARGLAH